MTTVPDVGRRVVQCPCGASKKWTDERGAVEAGWSRRRENGLATNTWLCPECRPAQGSIVKALPPVPVPLEVCLCGHVRAAHQSNGRWSCAGFGAACPCKRFRKQPSPKSAARPEGPEEGRTRDQRTLPRRASTT